MAKGVKIPMWPKDGAALLMPHMNGEKDSGDGDYYWSYGLGDAIIFNSINDLHTYIEEELDEEWQNEYAVYILNNREFEIEEYEEMVPVKKFRLADKKPDGLV